MSSCVKGVSFPKTLETMEGKKKKKPHSYLFRFFCFVGFGFCFSFPFSFFIPKQVNWVFQQIMTEDHWGIDVRSISVHVCHTLISIILLLLYIFCLNLSALQTDIAFCSAEIITFLIGNLKKFFFPNVLSRTAGNRNFGVRLSFRLWEKKHSYGNNLESFSPSLSSFKYS